MFHVEMRMGIDAVREFNLSEQGLWTRFLAPLMADRDFVLEGHEFTPRKTRIKIFDGPELRPHELGMGRGWQNVERKGTDVTEAALTRAHAHAAAARSPSAADQPPAAAAQPPVMSPPAVTLILRERLVGRLSARPASAPEILALASELMPDAGVEEQVAAGQRAVWSLLEGGDAQLAPPSGE